MNSGSVYLKYQYGIKTNISVDGWDPRVLDSGSGGGCVGLSANFFPALKE